MSAIIKYNNNMNTLQFKKFKDKELDLFFSICHKLKDKGLDEITLQFSELKELSNYSSTSLLRFEKDLNSTYKKLLALNFKINHSENKYTLFNLFSKYTVDIDCKEITIALNKEFSYILNELGTTYTKFELEQFTSLKSVYSKNLFKLLKQWESLRKKTFEIEKFKYLLNIPESYNFSKINEKVLKPILKELPFYFLNLKLEKIKKGRRIVELKFTWAAKNMKQEKLLEVEIVISERLEKSIEKTKKNKFVNPILTKENIKKLLEIFDEKILINAFSKAYTVIKKEINFNYLKTFIENTLKQQKIKFTVAKDVENVETIEEKKEELKMETRDPKEKIKVTEDEKKQKYEEYLKENNLQNNKFNKKSFEVTFNNAFEVIDIERPQTEKICLTEIKYNQLLKLEVEKQRILNEIDDVNLLNTIAKAITDKRYKSLKSSELDIDHQCAILEEIGEQSLHESERNEFSYIDYLKIEKEKLLSKNGKKLFGGALISRLKKIAREENIKIKYKEKIIK